MSAVRALILVAGLAGSAVLAGCDMLGIEPGSAVSARKEAEGKAVGSACRQALRAIEDCYTLNPKASKAAVFAGWREMDEYMRENKLEGIVPVIPRKGAAPSESSPASEAPSDDKATRKASAKSTH
ncbi:MAG: hypothetical protein ABI574_11595 [Burkholderiales bacterium]